MLAAAQNITIHITLGIAVTVIIAAAFVAYGLVYFGKGD